MAIPKISGTGIHNGRELKYITKIRRHAIMNLPIILLGLAIDIAINIVLKDKDADEAIADAIIERGANLFTLRSYL